MVIDLLIAALAVFVADPLCAERGTTGTATARLRVFGGVLGGFGGRPLGRSMCVRVWIMLGWLVSAFWTGRLERRIGGVRVSAGRGGWVEMQCAHYFVVADVCPPVGWPACRLGMLLGVRWGRRDVEASACHVLS